MANSILTSDIITRKALEVFENSSVMVRNVNKQYDNSFAVEGAKIGASARIRLPDRALVTDGAALLVQEENEQYTTLTINKHKHIGLNFTQDELTLSLDDFSERVLVPRISQLAAAVESDISDVYQDIFNSVGTPGTSPATALVLLQAQQKLNEGAVAQFPRYATVNPAANAALVNGLSGLFNPGSTVSRQFKTGMMGEGVLGYNEINMSQSIKSLTTGSRTATADTLQVNATISTQGASTIAIKSGTGSATIKKGEVFTIASVYAVNPQTRESTGALQQFVVTADATASSGTWSSVSISPAIYTSDDALATVNAFPLVNAYINFVGAASTVYPQNLVYHPNAITLATVDLPLPRGVDMASRVNHNGISMALVRDFDINNYRMPCRLDILYGFKVIRPQMACRLWG